MKWISVILMGILIMGCAASPVVTNRQTIPNQYDIDKKKEPVITQRELSENQFEITMKSGWENFWGGCVEFMKYANKLCEERTGKRAFKAKKTEVDSRSNNAIWTRVSVIECLPKGFWTKKNGDKSERQKDFYECNKDVHLFFDKRIASSNPCELIELNEPYWNFFEFCLRSKGYEFAEIIEKEDPNAPDKIK